MDKRKGIEGKLIKYLNERLERDTPHIPFREVVNFVIKDRKEQLALHCADWLPHKEELFPIYKQIIEEKHKGLDELEKEWIKLGFIYYHHYLSEKREFRTI